MKHRRRRLSLLLIGLAVACARPPQPTVHDVYRGRSESLPRLDPAILDGRCIVIDPGHGGAFDGTRGQNGLREASVNLGVSLYLWGLLREAGADVHLTRSAERDFLDFADSTLASDLQARVVAVDSLAPDIFVSIHHNAQPERDPGKNAVETYYRFGDPASRDLAFAIHRHLMRNLGIEDGEVRPGNYFVLRNVDYPAVLGESSYLTHPAVEESLKLSDKQELEAEAYFLGILEYFSRGTPRLAITSPLDSIVNDVPTLVFSCEDVGGLGIDPGSIELRINGHSRDATLDGDGHHVRYSMPWDASNGVYDTELLVRNVLGNSSRIVRASFRLELPARSATFERVPEALPAAGGVVRVRARLLDRRGLSIADGTPVAVETSSGESPDSVVVTGGFIDFPVEIATRTNDLTVRLSAGGRTFENVAHGDANATTSVYRRFVVVDASTGKSVKAAAFLRGDSLVASASKRGDYFVALENEPDMPTWVSANGYLPRSFSSFADATGDSITLEPWFDGALLGKRFVIDPEGGFGEGPGLGRLGLSGPFVSLQVARYLEEYLERAGAEVALTRRTEESLTPRDVVALANRFRADRYIEIRHRAAPDDSALAVASLHFPGSTNGAKLAASLQAAVAATLGLPERTPAEQVTFTLQQTACPAVIVEFPSIHDIDEELRLGEPWYQRKQAYGAFLGVLAHYGVTDSGGLAVTIDTDSPRTNWLVTLDRTWRLLTGSDGIARFGALAAGTHTVEVRRGEGFMGPITATVAADSVLVLRVPLRAIH